MNLTPERGQELAEVRAREASDLYRKAQRIFGQLISPYMGDAPPALGLAHVVGVNPALATAPTPTKDRRRGFMYATVDMAKAADIEWKNLDKPLTCAYVWGRDVNATAKSLYEEKAVWFPTIGTDFWKCTYFRYRFGPINFATIWAQRDSSQSTIFESLLYAVNTLSKPLQRLTVAQQKHLAMFECPYVFELSKYGGGMYSAGYGLEPVLSKNNYQQVYS